MLVSLALAVLTLMSSAPFAEKTVSPLGAPVPNFMLKDIHRRPVTLDGFKDRKAFVAVFVGTECALANLYVPTLVELHTDYAGQAVQLLLINSKEQDACHEVAA